MADTMIETLLKDRQYLVRERWYPRPVDNYKSALKIDMRITHSEALRSNMAYSLQYLEFLELEFKELKPSSVISTMLIKTYVITGMSIIEGLFTNIIKSHGWWKKTNLESIGSIQASEKKFGEEKYIIKTELFKKIPEKDVRMDLDALIKILDRHREALNVDHLVYPELKRLKKLRNRVHIQMNDSDTDHDYNAFDEHTKKEMGSILYRILTSNMITDAPNIFEFLRVNIDS